MSMAMQNSVKGNKILFYSLETSPDVTARNFICACLKIKPETVEDKSYTEQQTENIKI